MKKLSTFLLFSVLSHMAWALETPKAMENDARLKFVHYQTDNVVPIDGMTFITTQVIFGQHEKIIDVQGGDAAAWTININPSLNNVLNIKPTLLNSNSNLTVVTLDDKSQRRYYRFQLSSHKRGKADNEVYTIQFIYPQEEKPMMTSKLAQLENERSYIKQAMQQPQNYNWQYSFHGSRSLRPLRVFDDGRFTYLQFKPNQPIPAIFVVNNNKGKESVVNYRRIDDYIILHEIAPQLTFRNGPFMVASIFNDHLIDSMKGFK